MPIVFLFSAIVSGMAMVLLIYMVATMMRQKTLDMKCINKLGELLLYAMIVDFSLEVLDFIQRLYEAEESITILSHMITNRLFISLIVPQIILGSVIPMASIIWARFGRAPDEMRRLLYFVAAILIQVGIFSTRWNVVIGGQLFSKSLRGLTVYKTELLGLEGVLMSGALFVAPFIILYIISRFAPPWSETQTQISNP